MFVLSLPLLFSLVVGGSYGSPKLVPGWTTLTLEQPIDHFSFEAEGTFTQKILVNDTFFNLKDRDSPILFYCGNEGPIYAYANAKGWLYERAAESEIGALVVFAEHRYYGDSFPYPPNELYYDEGITYPNPKLQYFTIEQALLDFVRAIEFIRARYNVSDRSAVIAFGGSYGGMLASYMRLKYPWVVDGALASSAPVAVYPSVILDRTKSHKHRAGQEPPKPHELYSRYYEIVTDNYAQIPGCDREIQRVWNMIDDAVEDGHTDDLVKGLKLCRAPTTFEDARKLKQWLVDAWSSLAEANLPYAMYARPANPVQAACAPFKRRREGVAYLKQVHESVSVAYNASGSCGCVCFNPMDARVTDLSQLSWDYQTCTQLNTPLSMNGDKDMFYANRWNQTARNAECMARWGVSPDVNWGLRQIGSFDTATNIIFSNGGRDPWSGGGFQRDISPSVVVLNCPDCSHTMDLRWSDPHDYSSTRHQRDQEMRIVGTWIRHRREHGSAVPHARPPPPPHLVSPRTALWLGLVLGVLIAVLAALVVHEHELHGKEGWERVRLAVIKGMRVAFGGKNGPAGAAGEGGENGYYAQGQQPRAYAAVARGPAGAGAGATGED